MGPLRGTRLLLKAGVLLLAGATHLGAATLDEAQRLFYTALFADAAAAAHELTTADPGSLAAWEVRTSALHFQLRRLVGDGKDKKAAFAKCADCPKVLQTFLDDVNRGREIARARLEKNPKDDEARFFLGKMDLSYLWMQLATLDRKTGWKEYWEAKGLLEDILAREPMHVRARTARAWMDYIVGTRVPWGTRWVMGGGNKGRALKMVREAAETKADFFTEVEARFALQEMLTREGKREEAVEVAKELLARFPDNKDLAKFVETGVRPTPRS
jgi:tetratricopeptide (TPR) repeat protein